MRIHHLNCGSLCPRGGRLFGGAGGLLSAAPMCCHCLLIEGDDRLILVDTGLGVEDVNEPRRLGIPFNTIARPRLEVAETALRRAWISATVQATCATSCRAHLDLDHAGGLSDFPGAAVHVFAAELRAASHRSSLNERNRYRAVQIAAVRKWAAVEEEGESWFGFSAVRAIPGTRDQVLLVPLPGHTRGHCGVAIRRENDWRSIAATPISIAPRSSRTASLRRRACAGSKSLMDVDSAERRANQARLRELARLAAGEVKLIGSHDLVEFAAMRSAERGERTGQQPVSTPRRPSQGGVRAAVTTSPPRLSCPAAPSPRRGASCHRRGAFWRPVSAGWQGGSGGACAFMSRSVSRARASSRLRGWLAKLWAKMTMTPS